MTSRSALILMAIVLGIALANGFNLLFRLSYVLAVALVLGYFWTWLNLRWLEASVERRTLRTRVGGKAEERITVHNTSLLPKAWLEVRDPCDPFAESSGLVISLRGKDFRSWKSEAVCRKRGVFSWGPLHIVGGDPFGLFRQARVLGKSQTLLVYPATVSLPHFVLPSAGVGGEGRWRRRTPWVTPNAAGLREYAYGDSLHRIHWPSTARHRRLMVKEFDEEPSGDLWVLLDLEERVHRGSGEESTEEYGVTLAASVAERYLKEPLHSVGLAAYGDVFHLHPPDRGSEQLNRIMEGLAQAKTRGSLSLSQALERLARPLSKNVTLVLITPSTEDFWIARLSRLQRRGLQVVVILLEASTFGQAPASLMVLSYLAAAGIPVYLVKKGDNLTRALSASWLEPVAALADKGKTQPTAERGQ